MIDRQRPIALGQIVYAYRARRNITARQFAHDVGISVTALYNIESGRTRDPHEPTIANIARAMRRSVKGLLDEVGALSSKDAVTPSDITLFDHRDISDLAEWVNNKPDTWSRVISTRLALRVIPEAKSIDKSIERDREEVKLYLIALFRLMHSAWYVTRYERNLSSILEMARENLSGVANADRLPKSAYDAGGAIYSATSSERDTRLETAVDWAFRSLGDKNEKKDDVLRSINIDRDDLNESRAKPRRLAQAKLWPFGQPPWLTREFRSFEKSVRSLGADWSFWIKLYESRLNGNSTLDLEPALAERLDTFIVDQTELWWSQSSERINEELTSLVEILRAENSEPKETDSETTALTQRPAPHQFGERDGKIFARPTPSQLRGSPLATDIWKETVEKAEATLERLRSTQAPSHVIRTMERLIVALGDSVEQVAPGILLMRSRSIDADLATFDTEQARGELMSDAQSLIRDLSASLEDLRALFPEIMEIEAARIAQRVTDGTAAQAFEGAKAVIAEARSSDVVDRSAVEALEAVLVDISETDEIIKESTNELVVAEAVQAKAKLISLHLLDVRNFSASALKSFRERSHQAARGTARAISQGVTDVSQRVYKGALDGVEESAKAGTKVALAALVTNLAGPLAGLAVVVGSFVSLSRKAKEVSEEIEKEHRDEGTEV